MLIDEIILKLEERSGMRPLKFSDEGVISFIFNEQYTTNIEKSTDDKLLTIYGSIGKLPLEDREAIMESLLGANLFGQGTGGSSIGMNPDTQEVYLFKTLDVNHIEFESFFEELTRFLQVQQEWTNEFTNYGFSTPQEKSNSTLL